MKANGWERIVNMCTGSAYGRNHNAYALAKMGVHAIIKSLALDLRPKIAVNPLVGATRSATLPGDW